MKLHLILIIVIAAILESCQGKHTTSLNDNTGIVYPPECKAVIDVTKPSYNLENTGKEDCAEKLVALIDSLTWRTILAIDSTKSIIAMNTDTFLFFVARNIMVERTRPGTGKWCSPTSSPIPKLSISPTVFTG